MGLSGMKIQLCSSGVKAGCGASSSTSSGGGVVVAVVPSSVILSSTSIRRAAVPLKALWLCGRIAETCGGLYPSRAASQIPTVWKCG